MTSGWDFLRATQRKKNTIGINDLPPDVLGEIFILCAFEDELWPFFAFVPDWMDRAPIKLTYVCRLWRFICLSLPTLWVVTPFTVLPHPSCTSLLGRYLDRSGKTGLQLDISDSSMSKAILPIVLPQSYRWKAVILPAEGPSMEEFLSLPPDSTPSLAAIAVRTTYPTVTQTTLSLFTSKINDISSLRQISLHLIDHPAPHINPNVLDLDPIPFERMTHVKLCVKNLSSREATDILQRCTSAVHVSIMMVLDPPGVQPPDPNSTPRIELPHLKSLTVQSSTAVGSILGHFSCPSLRRLYIRDLKPFTPSDYDEDELNLTSFLDGTSLEQLIICTGLRRVTWEWALRYARLCREQVANLEIRVVRPLGPRVELFCSEQYRCPAAKCELPHVGWSSRKGEHLGAPLRVTEWEEPFWTVFDPHESLQWDDWGTRA
ncbi:hypothetical protein CC1G_00746 [Coprinopsis cinerea okayama7|uniref:F-box domain-containing protein n=1 Tax=Coprinopsis cinerea (strain Okayama-7 / 130 / ATCC MYA-4618 / FGSC 9003) TaxID=240176 RepID=A8N9D2_COPC7|nr:hypothetical protein CC1G_00746 [Coprinopsis cinerea okayama7\|eukprot:XP_001831199.2 hypothetical protein CC1G_00746 [Coprinopsis cinerea okayama7\